MTTGAVAGPCDNAASPHARLRTLPLHSASITGAFWGEARAVNRTVSLKHGYAMLERAGNLHNLRLAGGLVQGDYKGTYPFLDSDLYKWQEAVAWELGCAPDAELRTMLDESIEIVARAQAPDGYLNSYYTVVRPTQRWLELKDGHELYCAGHLFQAAVALQRATGDGRLLATAQRFADYIDSVFGPGKRAGVCGHPEIETALVELYRETGQTRYLTLARYFVDARGHDVLGAGAGRAAYYQDHVPVRQATTVEGHAVRQLYLAAGVADMYMETGEEALLHALLHQWHDMTSHKLFITGGVGSRSLGEAFGEPYELPNDICYCETCAQIASIMWAWRLLLITGEARFADVMERQLFNSFMSGRSLDGRCSRYENPLQRRGQPAVWGHHGNERKEWYACACCPPNIMRLLASLPHYAATRDDQGIQIQQYIAGDLAAQLPTGAVRLRSQTDYPWQEVALLSVSQTPNTPWRLSLRLPAWCSAPALKINGRRVAIKTDKAGYAVIERVWKVCDVIELDLPMPPRLMVSHPRIDPARGSMAIERGPLVYCLESFDQPDGVNLMDVAIAREPHFETVWHDDLLGGVVVIKARGYALDAAAWGDDLYRAVGSHASFTRRPIGLTAIPYYAWDNRGLGAMRVWIAAENAA